MPSIFLKPGSGFDLTNLQTAYTASIASSAGLIDMDETIGPFHVDGANLAAGVTATTGSTYFMVSRGGTDILATAYNATDLRATVYSNAINGLDIAPAPDLFPDRGTIHIGFDKLTFLRQSRDILSPPGGFFLWNSSMRFKSVADGGSFAPFGPTVGGFITLAGRFEFQQNANPFGMGNAILHAATWTGLSGSNLGPAFLFANNAVYQADGGATTISQARIFFDNTTYNVINGGTLTGGTIGHNSLYAATTVNTGATILLRRAVFIPDVTGTGILNNQVGIDITDLDFGVIANIGIRSAMNVAPLSGAFIDASGGTAISHFGGDIHMNDAVALVLGTSGSTGITELLRSSAGVLRMIGRDGANNEALEWDFQTTANEVNVDSSTGAAIRFNVRVDINNGDALGGGAAPTFGTIGGTGPTAAAQAQWVEIDIAGTPHWIPVWT